MRIGYGHPMYRGGLDIPPPPKPLPDALVQQGFRFVVIRGIADIYMRFVDYAVPELAQAGYYMYHIEHHKPRPTATKGVRAHYRDIYLMSKNPVPMGEMCDMCKFWHVPADIIGSKGVLYQSAEAFDAPPIVKR